MLLLKQLIKINLQANGGALSVVAVSYSQLHFGALSNHSFRYVSQLQSSSDTLDKTGLSAQLFSPLF